MTALDRKWWKDNSNNNNDDDDDDDDDNKNNTNNNDDNDEDDNELDKLVSLQWTLTAHLHTSNQNNCSRVVIWANQI